MNSLSAPWPWREYRRASWSASLSGSDAVTYNIKVSVKHWGLGAYTLMLYLITGMLLSLSDILAGSDSYILYPGMIPPLRKCINDPIFLEPYPILSGFNPFSPSYHLSSTHQQQLQPGQARDVSIKDINWSVMLRQNQLVFRQ